MSYEPSRPYRYLRSLAIQRKKRGKLFWWFVFHFVLFPRIPWDYWLFCIDSKSHNEGLVHKEKKNQPGLFSWFTLQSWSPPVLCIITYFIAGGFFKARFISHAGTTYEWIGVGGFVIWVLFSITVNLISLLMIDLIAMPYKESASELEHELKENIVKLQNSLKKQIDKISEDILGHKLWARRETHQLFEGLTADKSGKRAKWFIVNFLSHLANDRIYIRNDLAGDLYSISTGRNDWPISFYSNFLAKNMDHAESEILWLVDPDDFFGILLPEFASYVLAAQTVAAFGKLPDIELDVNLEDPPSARSVFSVYEQPPTSSGIDESDWGSFYEEVISKITSDIILQASDPNQADNTWAVFQKAVLHPTIQFGAELIKKSGLLSKEDIMMGFKHWTHKYLDGLFPHLMAFRNAESPIIRKRVIFLGRDMPKDTTSFERWVRKKIQEYWESNVERWSTILSSVQYEGVIDLALDLFVYTCGGEKTLSAQGSLRGDPPSASTSAEDAPANVAWDVGWYDRQFVVSAEETKNFPPRRKVEWYYGSPPKDATEPKQQEAWREMLPPRIRKALVLLDAAPTDGGASFAMFRKCLKEFLEDLESDNAK